MQIENQKFINLTKKFFEKPKVNVD